MLIPSGLLAVPLALMLSIVNPPQRQAEMKTVVIEAPNITCHSRFVDSLKANIIKKHDWIHSVSIEYREPAQVKDLVNFKNALRGDSGRMFHNDPEKRTPLIMGRTAVLKFKISTERSGVELAKSLERSGYYATSNWTLVRRIPFKDLD